MRNRKLLNLGEKPLKMACRSIDKIAQPLFESFDLTFFSYKLSQDDKFIFLTNNYPWLKNCLDKDYATFLSSFQPEHEIIIWDALPKDSPVMVVYEDAKTNFNIDHGVTIIKSVGTKEEHFNFATTRDHYEMNNFYFQHREILERFILYFRDKAKKIIDAALTHAISLQELGMIKSALMQQEFYREIDYFIENTQIKTIQIEVEGKSIDLNYTLAHTGYYLLQELSFKKIAKACYVSVKTVEARLAKLRKITGTKNKKELVEFLNKTDVRKTLDLALQKKSRHVHSKLGWISRFLS